VPPTAVGTGGLAGMRQRLGERVSRRPEPRFGVALAGVGMLMIVVGVVAWGGDAAGGGGEGDSNQIVGVLLSLAVIAAGYLLLVRFRHGPLATAGVVAAALGVPLLMGFATFDSEFEAADSDVFFALPFSVDTIVLLSLAAWLASYIWVPVASGRVFFLALSAFTLWLYLLEKVEEGAAGYVLTLPFSAIAFSFSSSFEEARQLPDPGTIGGMSLIVGLVYYVLAIVADRQGHRGLTTPFLAAGFVATVVGIIHMADDLQATGTGLLLILIGTVLAVYGVTRGRRFTAWTWAAGIGLGVLVILTDAFDDNAAAFGVAAMVLGAGVVLVAHLVAQQFAEPDELAPGPTRFVPRPRPPRPPWAPTGQFATPQGPPSNQPWPPPVAPSGPPPGPPSAGPPPPPPPPEPTAP
jgi:putative effector of murein hydrolase LrgA (UPF0299 family)